MAYGKKMALSKKDENYAINYQRNLLLSQLFGGERTYIIINSFIMTMQIVHWLRHCCIMIYDTALIRKNVNPIQTILNT